VIDQTIAAKESGADYVLVLVPAVFHWAQDANSIVDFFVEVANHSPLPVMIYNCPIIVGGIDLNSDMLEKLAPHPNISGVKMTCANIGKMGRVAAQFPPEYFTTLAGSSDLLVSALIAGGVGCITGVANLFPKVRDGSSPMVGQQWANPTYRPWSRSTTSTKTESLLRPSSCKRSSPSRSGASLMRTSTA
jgi:dihydrodipicolinate synthase/N-acetylneuraminate lyase